MDKIVYVVIGLVIVLVVVGLALFLGNGRMTVAVSSAATTASAAVSPQITTSNRILSACTPTAGYTCDNVTYSYLQTQNISFMWATISQESGRQWSGFGVGYAPLGTAMSGGIPEIAFNTANASSTSNVGTLLQSGQNVTVMVDRGEKGIGALTTGTIWVCYVNSGTLYVGNGCTTAAGVAATYVEIGIVNATST
jgi:hypothetical protein